MGPAEMSAGDRTAGDRTAGDRELRTRDGPRRGPEPEGGTAWRQRADERIAVLEDIVRRQGDALHQAGETMQQMRDEFLVTWELVSRLTKTVAQEQERVSMLGSAAMARHIESQDTLIGVNDYTRTQSPPGKGPAPAELQGAQDEQYLRLLALVASGKPPRTDKHAVFLQLPQDAAQSPAAPSSPANAPASKPGHESVGREEEETLQRDDASKFQWSSVNENAYGAFIHVALTQGLSTAVSRCLLAVVVSCLVQGVFSLELFFSLPDVFASGTHICDIPSDLQLAAIFVFVTMMLNNGPGDFLLGLWCGACVRECAKHISTHQAHK